MLSSISFIIAIFFPRRWCCDFHSMQMMFCVLLSVSMEAPDHPYRRRKRCGIQLQARRMISVMSWCAWKSLITIRGICCLDVHNETGEFHNILSKYKLSQVQAGWFNAFHNHDNYYSTGQFGRSFPPMSRLVQQKGIVYAFSMHVLNIFVTVVCIRSRHQM